MYCSLWFSFGDIQVTWCVWIKATLLGASEFRITEIDRTFAFISSASPSADLQVSLAKDKQTTVVRYQFNNAAPR
jgi:hypothetical protein